jgi:hypothetical protein
MVIPKRFQLLWEPGLCRHGCGDPVRKGRSFINGHDGMLMDLLVDAHRAGSVVSVTPPSEPFNGSVMEAREWAVHAFSEKGLRDFDWRANHPNQLRMTADKPVAELEADRAAAWSTEERSGLEADLATIREIVGHQDITTAEGAAEAEATIDRLEAQIDRLQEQLNEATRPVYLTVEGLGSASDKDVLQAARARAQLAAGVLDRARYEGDANEVWDLSSVFDPSSPDPIRAKAARAFLGGSEWAQ